MQTLTRTVRSIDKSGASLDIPFRSWSERGISLRRGEVSMVAGNPGAGKSTIALAVALKSQQPTLYFSMDSHASTMAIRSLAMITGLPQRECEERMALDQAWASDLLALYAGHISWCFDSNPSLYDVEDEIEIYREMKGSDPVLIVVDNATDVTHDDGYEFGSLRSLMRECKSWARETNATFLILHHTSESYGSNPCPPRSALHGKVAQVPSLVLTVASDTPGWMAVASVKNRYGAADSSGQTAIWMKFLPESMLLEDM